MGKSVAQQLEALGIKPMTVVLDHGSVSLPVYFALQATERKFTQNPALLTALREMIESESAKLPKHIAIVAIFVLQDEVYGVTQRELPGYLKDVANARFMETPSLEQLTAVVLTKCANCNMPFCAERTRPYANEFDLLKLTEKQMWKVLEKLEDTSLMVQLLRGKKIEPTAETNPESNLPVHKAEGGQGGQKHRATT